MADYGLTPKGPNIKRADVILEDMHKDLSEKWGVNTRQNPESLLNHMLSNVADRIAELWEFGEQVYYSQYPSSAEGTSLDNAAQYGGSTREPAAKSYYPIHCTGKDGTTLAVGTTIATTTNPSTHLSLSESRQITRAAFNKAQIKIAELSSSIYTVVINGAVFSFEPNSESAESGDSAQIGARSILNGLANAIQSEMFDAYVDEESEILEVNSKDKTSTNEMILSENLTTETVTSIITFGTVETGDILLPEGVITTVVKADAGLMSVVNLCSYVAGRNEESDAEFRKSYADKIFNRSSRMLESIRSAILEKVQGVKSVAPYENPSYEWDEQGRPPHSIEIVVDGGDSTQIAKQILENKAGGIITYGDTTVIVPGAYDEDIKISFSRPKKIYTWFHLGITQRSAESLPENHQELLRNVILENMALLEAGSDVVPQQFMSYLYKACSGISYIDIKLFVTDDPGAKRPEEYPLRSVAVTAREIAYTTEQMVEVVVDA